ncbi:hypothetical protein LCGC14_0940380 [marine sediment metagenome]|uniref:Uncharacterized protein n=1 Tax=marine sediment metagenome TaxID=412755 RepID=A0A0F9NK89_9ZZZZ
MRQGDKVTKKGEDWLGTASWVDNVERKVGVVYNSPKLYAGGSKEYDIDDLEVVGNAKEENDLLAKMSVAELREEIDKLRKDRSERLARPTVRRIRTKKEPSEMHQLALLIQKHGAEKVREIMKGG